MTRSRSSRRFEVEELARSALRVLDVEGLVALTMRRMATEMGVATTSSLYWRVRTKDDLLRLAVDEVYAELLRGLGDGHDLRRVLDQSLTTLLRHPWCAGLTATHAQGAAYVRYCEVVLAALAEAGVPPARQSAAMSALGFYIAGAVQQLSAWRAAGSAVEPPEMDEGSPLADYWRQVSKDVDEHVRAGLELIVSAVLA